ncbi:unnamed protein product [Cyclocybe aegerita]|uniref:F-box domain-containing protein n=1 Tax=Cyclocybe aegerita TaxID=1973307 RepID=A0A8S0VSX0_CYCAE|nr:unnamed protein product [Cyclocybe aegerita]
MPVRIDAFDHLDLASIPAPFDAFDLAQGTNSRLSNDDAKTVQSRLRQRQDELHMILALLAQAYGPRKHLKPILEEKQAQLEDQIRRFKIALAPWKSLPPEIIQDVFLLLRDGSITFPPMVNRAPLLLCRICSPWRSLALETPGLWSSASLFLDTTAESVKISRNVFALYAFLDRAHSKNVPLHLELREQTSSKGRGSFPHYAAGSYDPKSNLITNSVVPFTRNLQSLSLTVSPENFTTFVRLPSGTLDSLLTLHLEASMPGPTRASDGLRKSFTPFGSTPRLKSLILDFSPLMMVDPQFVNFPWHSIRYLHCRHHISLDTFLEIMESCASAEELQFLVAGRKGATITPNRASLPELRALDLTFAPDSICDPFFLPYTLPNLNSLTIKGDADVFFSSKRPWVDILESMQCDIHHLELDNVDPELVQMDDIIAHTPSLKTLVTPPNTALSPECLRGILSGQHAKSLERLRITSHQPLAPVLELLEYEGARRKRSGLPSASRLRCLEIDCDRRNYVVNAFRLDRVQAATGIMVECINSLSVEV